MKRLLVLMPLIIMACGTPSPTPSPIPSSPPTMAPSPSQSPSPVAGDPCHVNGQVYCLVNPNVTFATRTSTICVSGWTGTVRPPVSYTDSLKVQQMAAENLPGTTANYEEDHRLPLTGGGYPGEVGGPVENLAPESRSGQGGISGSIPASTKDSAEYTLGKAMCASTSEQEFLSLQSAFVIKWLAPFPAYP